MIDTIFIHKGNGTLQAQTEEGAEKLAAEYKKNQPVRGKITRASDVVRASDEQSGLLHSCFKLVSDNSELPNHRTPALVKESCKVAIDFRDMSLIIVRPDGGVQFSYRSFAYDKLKGVERNRVIQQAFQWCADVIGLEDIIDGKTAVDQLIEEAKSRMQRR